MSGLERSNLLTHLPLALTQPAWGNATLIEIIWTVLGVLGIIITLYTMLQAIRDWVIARLDKRAVYRQQAEHNKLQEIIRLVKVMIVTAIGVYAMTSPQSESSLVLSISTVLISLGLILIVVLTVAQSVLDIRIRHVLNRHLKEKK